MEPGGVDVEALRADTPGCGQGLVFLNSAGSSLPSRGVLAAQVAHLELEARVGGYRAAELAGDQLMDTRQALVELIGAGSTGELALLGSASEAWKLAFYGADLGPGDRVLVGRAAYGGNAIAMLQRQAATGCEVEVIDDDEHGQTDVVDLERRLGRGRVALVCLTWVPTGSGLVNPARAVCQLARSHGVPTLLDACQAVGQRVIDVEELGCDFLSGTGRKYLRGPRGTGFLWVRPEVLAAFEPPMLDNTSATWTGPEAYQIQAGGRRFETYESAVAARVGLGVAVREALAVGVPAIEARVTWLGEQLRGMLAEVPGVAVRDGGVERCGIVTFTRDGEAAAETRRRLREGGVECSLSGREGSRWLFGEDGPEERVRASVHAFNTVAELERAVAVVAG